MPESKKRIKSGKKRRRDGAPTGSTPAEPSGGGGGFLGKMRGGIQDLAGSAPKKKESLLSKILTWALVAVALWLLARRFGILR